MLASHRNPLHVLGDYTWTDYYCFKDHLRLPLRYLRVIFRNYRQLNEAFHQLPVIIRKTNDHDWEKLMTEPPTMQQKIYRTMNIPPLFFADKPVTTLKVKEQVDFEWLIDHAHEAVGQTFYFYSEFSEGAMNAAFAVMKGTRGKCTSYCTSFPELLADLKEGWDTHSVLQTYIRSYHLAVIYAVGSEYSTEFTQNQLQEILQSRTAHGLVTILCSSLTPRDYVARYKVQPEGIEIGFKDQKIKLTLAQLKEELSR